MLYLFEDCVLDTDKLELRRGDIRVHVEAQTYDLLELLIRNRERLVGMDELIEKVWKGANVSNSAVSSRISATRRAIGDDGKSQRLIRTTPKKGLRFVGAVAEVNRPASLERGPAADSLMASADAEHTLKASNPGDDTATVSTGRGTRQTRDPAPVTPQTPPVAARLPAMPTILVGRDDDLVHLKARVGISAKTVQRRVTVVRGWPGVGKTSLVNALANDPEVISAFPDGVLWAALGELPNPLGELMAWARALGARIADSRHEVQDVTFEVRRLLHGRQVLLILDDVWEFAAVVPFNVAGPRCATLITTRDAELARSIATTPSDVYWLNKFDETRGLELLAHVAPSFVGEHSAGARQLVNDLDGLPLALRVAGRLLEEEIRIGWGNVQDLLAELSATTRLLAARAPEDRYDPRTGTFPTVSLLLKRSTDRLDDQTRRRFADLGSFRAKPATFDLDAIHYLWRSTDVQESKETARTLVNRGLLEPIQAKARFQMHALLVLHARSLPEQAPPDFWTKTSQ
jgi:DNA-binding winged helix-turn-helix (wHTH) protein